MAVNSAAVFKQTSRTILFEHFSDDESCFSLKRVLSDFELGRAPSKKNREELESLYVYSFKEFITRFAPPVYEMIFEGPKDDDGNYLGPEFMFRYTMDKKEAQAHGCRRVQRLNENLYYQMIMEIYDAKCRSLASDFEFKDEDLLKHITPRYEVKKLEDMRQQMYDNQLRRYFGSRKGENVNRYIEKYDEQLDKFNEIANDNLVLIAQRLDDIRVAAKVPAAVKNATEMLDTSVAGYLALDKEGRLTFKQEANAQNIPLLDSRGNDEDVKMLESQAVKEIRSDIESEYRSLLPAESVPAEGDFTLNLLLKTLAPLDGQDINLPALEEDRRILESVYKSARDAFAKALCGEVEKLLGVKAFFDHATCDDGKFAPGLLVTNCTVEDLLEGETGKKFEEFIKYEGKEQTDQRIWLGILPGIYIGDPSEFNTEEVNLAQMTREERKLARERQAKQTAALLTPEKAERLVTILNDAHIMTFCNTRDSRNNEMGYESVTAGYLQDRKAQFDKWKLDHLVYSYPNFRIMDKRDVQLNPDEAWENSLKIELPGVYLDAAYPAAGLVAGTQQIRYLEKHGFANQVNPMNVCVHVNLEDKKIKKNLTSCLNLATNQAWGRVKEEAEGFGLAFCGEPKKIDGKEMEKTYVYAARTLGINGKGGYRSIYRVLLSDFITAYLDRNDCKKLEDFKKFQKTEVTEWKDELQKNETVVNYVLGQGEDIVLDNVDKKVLLKFADDEDSIKFEVKISD